MERILKLRKVIPPRLRRLLRKLLRELPVRLRFNVAGTSSRDAFTQVGSVDVDAGAIQWCRRNLRGDFRLLHPDDGLPFADGRSISFMRSPSSRTWMKRSNSAGSPRRGAC